MLPEPVKFRMLRAARPFFKLTFIDTVKKAFLQVHDFSTNRSFIIFCLLAKQKPNDIFDCSLSVRVSLFQSRSRKQFLGHVSFSIKPVSLEIKFVIHCFLL